jgi:geranylgeranyl reductase family protein
MRVAIVGAGPAGAMAALRLARAGAPVSLFDPSHPREKPCGGGLTGRALALVADCIDIASLPAVVVKSVQVESPDNGGPAAAVDLVDSGLAPASSLIVLSRAIFDRALVDAAVRAGARLIPEKVVDVGRGGPSLGVRTSQREYQADFVLGADGANSLTRKAFSAPFSRADLSVAAGFFVHGATSSAIGIKSMVEQPGYLWSFPRPDHLAIGICAPALEHTPSPQLRAQSLVWIRAHGLDRHTTLTPYAWPIPSIGSDARHGRSAGPGWMLLGDAAGLVDPLTREGIYYALLSGAWAAEALIGGSIAGAPGIYEQRLNEEIRPELARAARRSGLFFTPAFAALLVEALRQSAPIRELFAELVAGAQPYRGLRRRLLATRQWTLAWRALRMNLTAAFAGTISGVALPRHSTTRI